jgi:transposase InsO family protein
MVIDNGREFTIDIFQAVLATFDIQNHPTHPYTPEENGKFERLRGTMKLSIDYSELYYRIDDFVQNLNEKQLQRALKVRSRKQIVRRTPGEVGRQGPERKIASIRRFNDEFSILSDHFQK